LHFLFLVAAPVLPSGQRAVEDLWTGLEPADVPAFEPLVPQDADERERIQQDDDIENRVIDMADAENDLEDPEEYIAGEPVPVAAAGDELVSSVTVVDQVYLDAIRAAYKGNSRDAARALVNDRVLERGVRASRQLSSEARAVHLELARISNTFRIPRAGMEAILQLAARTASNSGLWPSSFYRTYFSSIFLSESLVISLQICIRLRSPCCRLSYVATRVTC
jgi:hypothetical protein